MAGLLDYQQPEQAAPGTFGNLTPQQIGLLNAGLSMMSAPKYASIGNGLVRGTSLGERVGPGIQQGLASLQQAQQDQHERAMQQAKMAKLFADTKLEQNKLTKQELFRKELSTLDPTDINGIKRVAMKYSTDPKELLSMLGINSDKSTYEFLNTDQGIVKGNKSTGALERALIDNGIVRNSNASPELQGQIASAKTHGSEMQKLFKTTDANGNEIFPTGAEVTGNNYGNIRPQGSDTGFQSYSTPEAGLAAIDQNLQAYGTKHGINTLNGVINRWAPPSENDTESYVKHVSSMLGLDPNQPIDLSNPAVRQAIGTGIMSHEGSLKKVFGQSSAQKESIKGNQEVQTMIAKEKAKQEIAQNDPIKLKAASDLNGILDSLSGHYDALDKINSIQNPNKGVIDNLKAGLASSDIGQYIANKAGTPGASERNSIENIRSTLVPVIMKASGMTGSQINSDAELQQFLKSLTNPKGDIKSVKEQIDLIRKRYAGGTSAKSIDNGGWSIKRVK